MHGTHIWDLHGCQWGAADMANYKSSSADRITGIIVGVWDTQDCCTCGGPETRVTFDWGPGVVGVDQRRDHEIYQGSRVEVRY